MIYRYENKEFRKVGQLKAKPNINRFLSVDVADINGNGRDEIFITNHWGDRLKSFVLEAVPGKKGLTRIWDDVNRYIRVLRDFDGTPMLVSQRPAFERPFHPGIQKINFKNGKYVVGVRLQVLAGHPCEYLLQPLGKRADEPVHAPHDTAVLTYIRVLPLHHEPEPFPGKLDL